MRTGIIHFLCALTALVQLTIPASAQSGRRPFSLSVSGSVFSDADLGKLTALPNTADVPDIAVRLEDIGPSFGLSFGYDLTERLELQFGFAYGRSEIIEDTGIGMAGVPLGANTVSKAGQLSYTGTLLFHFPFRRVSPYLSAGLGGVTLATEKIGSETSLLVKFGAGVKLRLSRGVSVFLGIEHRTSFFHYLEDFDVIFPAIYTPEFNRRQHRIGVRLGLVYSF